MSSPRKYSSPYLTGLPGLSNSSPSKAKRRSKTSITKPNSSSVISHDQNQGDSASDNSNPLSIECNQGNVDQSAGDVDNLIKEIQGGVSAVKLTDSSPESPDIAKDESGSQAPDPPEVKCQDAPSTPGDIGGASASAEITADAMGSSNSLPTQEDEPKDKSNANTTDELSAQIKCLSLDSDSRSSSSLKSILKPPTPYYKNKPKPVRTEGGGGSQEGSKKFASVNVKDLKMKSGKFGGRERDSKEREQPTRSLTKHRHGHASPSAVAGPSPIAKIDLFQQQQGQISMKTPRRRSKGPLGAGKGGLGGGGAPLVTKKAVRFSHKIDIYHVPYEARAGTRACDWQRNMLEQRVQSFRQLMKDVGSSSSEELDMFGNGLIFPSYPYHLPNPNFAMRGRVRNFKF